MGQGKPGPWSSPLLRRADELAHDAHEGPRRIGTTSLDHPRSVATLLQAEGFDEETVAAGLLHDVVEDSATDLDEIESAFGTKVRDLVAAMTEDDKIRSYERRKEEHRARAARDARVAAIYAADKLAKLRGSSPDEPVPAATLEHYKKTLRLLSRRHPRLPFLRELRAELELRDRAPLSRVS